MHKYLKNALSAAAALTVAAGLGLAQAPPPDGPHGPRDHMGAMASQLNLSPDQQSQAKAIFDQARQASKPLHDQMQSMQPDIEAAVKANDLGRINQLANTQGTLLGQLEAIRLQAQAKLYSILTPTQQQQFSNTHAGPWMGGGMGRGPRQ